MRGKRGAVSMGIVVFSIADPGASAAAGPEALCSARSRPAPLHAAAVIRRLLLPCLSCLAVACAPLDVTTEVGYARLALRGDLSLATNGGAATEQDVDRGFGLGDERDCPLVRVTAGHGPLTFGATGFWLRESGSGVLDEDFGGIPSGTSVTSDLELGVARCEATWGFTFGALRVAPGLALDVFAIDFRAESSPGNREEVDDVVAVPLPFVRADLAWYPVRAELAGGWIELPDGSGGSGRFFDVEAAMRWDPAANWGLVAGYRWLGAIGEGDAGVDTFGLDLEIRGWFVGAALRF